MPTFFNPLLYYQKNIIYINILWTGGIDGAQGIYLFIFYCLVFERR